MKNFIKTIFILCILSISSCTKKLPESYGVYLRTNNKLTPVEVQNISFKGNLFHVICGLKTPLCTPVSEVEEIIIYLQNTNADSWRLSKLKFIESANIPSPFGDSFTELNFWVKDFDINTAISPIEKKTDMYQVMPASTLVDGYYALHQGELDITDALSAADKNVFIFQIGGKVTGFNRPIQNESLNEAGGEYLDSTVVEADGELSNEEMMEASVEEVVAPVEEVVVEKANQPFNTQNFKELRKLFIKDDYTFNNDAEWRKLENGFRNWLQEAGKIKSSKVIDRNHLWSDTEYALVRMQTTYEKAGQITEEMEVVNYQDKFYIRFLGTR